MSISGIDALAKELGGPPPAGFSKLSSDELQDLVVTLHEIKRTQGAEIDESTEASIKGLPLMLRAPVRAIVGSHVK
jgi:hypothetical protein